MTDELEFKSDRELLLTIARRCGALIDTGNSTAGKVRFVERGVAHVVDLLDPPPRRSLTALGCIIFNLQTGAFIAMSNSQTRNLVNLANPAAATRALEIVDVAGGTVVPSVAVTSGNAALVAIVLAGALVTNSFGTTFTFGVYPVDTSPETNDVVTVVASLADGSEITYTYTINGSGETITADAGSSVASWDGTVPTTPV